MKEYSVKIDNFEGPLDLLLHLIQKAEVDIYHVPLKTITEQYLQYVQTMRELELDIASEYLVMAATLLQIKSNKLLPSSASDDTDLEEEYDEEELLYEQLLEYKKFKEAAFSLRKKENPSYFRYSKPDETCKRSSGVLKEKKGKEATLFDLIDAVKRIKRRQLEENPPVTTTVEKETTTITNRMAEIMSSLTKEKTIRFDDLFFKREKGHIVITFLAVLELVKNKKIRCVQSDNFADIIVEAREGTSG